MRGRVAVPFVILLLCATPPPLRAKRKPPPNSPSAATPAISVTSRIVVLDVVVLDRNKPVCGLTARDFHIFEDRQYQTIGFFQPHCGQRPSPNARHPMPKPPALPPHTYDNLPVSRVTDSVTVLLLDGLNTQASDNQYLRRQMLQYLRNLPPGRRIAIFALGSRLRLLQGFTTNSGQLIAAIASRKATPAASLLSTSGQNFQDHQMLAMMASQGMTPQNLGDVQAFMTQSHLERSGMRISMTLEAIRELARYLSGIPGRKNLVWFSGSFPVEFYGDFSLLPDGMGPGAVYSRYLAKLKSTANLLAAARVAVYPVDVRGVLAVPVFSAAQPGLIGVNQFARAAMMADMARIHEESAMDELAKETGGQAFYETNALKKAVAEALNDGSNFYTFAYSPKNEHFNGKWRKISVFLDKQPARGKYRLLYRSGYYATGGDSAAPIGSRRAQLTFGAAMQEGIPPSSQILFKVRVVAPDRHPPAGPIDGQNRKLTGRIARYAIDYAISPQHISLSVTPSGLREGRVVVEAVAFDPNGKAVNWLANIDPIILTPADWQRYAEDGLQVHQVLDLPKGTFRLRLGVCDPASGRIGSLEIPLDVGPKISRKTAARR